MSSQETNVALKKFKHETKQQNVTKIVKKIYYWLEEDICKYRKYKNSKVFMVKKQNFNLEMYKRIEQTFHQKKYTAGRKICGKMINFVTH